MKKTLLTLLAICASTQAFAFPNLKDYNGERIVLEDGSESFSSGLEKLAVLNPTKYQDVRSYSGTCPVTNCLIWVTDGEPIDSVCRIMKNDIIEESYLTEVIQGGVRYSFGIDDVITGRVIVFKVDGQLKAIMQSF
jgi:hypothetical protein